MKKNKKILSVTQYEKCNSLTGIFFMVSGIFYSSRRFEKNLPVLLIFIVISILAVIFTIVQHFGYDREELDEMANENLNTASRIVLMEEMLIGVGVMIVDFLVDMSKVVLSKRAHSRKLYDVESCIVCDVYNWLSNFYDKFSF